ncbi:hypothetical protein CAEBREN_25377 [Caenorhabditis brenneri]|uniref:Uncharacterized protein n=1 Tax=Caenorhabditis brenneri TaxID=135651 RepID=G0N256_CAEBE|nr:hypothetical protein CAEBREN_25377 [Caenorhabditis brenneri]
MSSSKDNKKPEDTVNFSEAVLEFFGLSTSLNEPEALQQLSAAERASHKEKLAQMDAHYQAKMNDFHGKWETRYYRDTNALRARMTELGGFKIQAQIQINESERLRIQALADLDAKTAELEAYKAQIQSELEELEKARLEANRALAKLKDLEAKAAESEAYKIQVQAKLHQSEQLKIQALKAWKACKSEFEDYKILTQGEFEELENARVKAHRVLVSLRSRCSELEDQAHQTLQQALDIERAAHSAQLQKVYDNWDAKYKKDIGYLKGKLAEVEARQAEVRQAEVRQAEARQAEARQAEARQAEVRQAEARQAEVRQAEVRQAEARQAEARQAEARQAEPQTAVLQAEIVRLNQLVESQGTTIRGMKLEQEDQTPKKKAELPGGQTLLEIQLKKPQEDLRTQLERSQAEVRQVWGIVKEMEEELEKLSQAQAPKKRGRSSKDQDAVKSPKKRKFN